MQKRGFTLIELLAVIVVLAIIATIAAPMVMNTISDARRGAALASAESYIDEVDKQISASQLNDRTPIADGTYSVAELADVKMKGNAPTKGQVIIENGEVTKAKLYVDGYSIDYDGKETKESINNYDGTDIVLNINGEELKQELSSTVEFTNVEINSSTGTNIVCNNGAIIHLEGNKAIVTNALGSATCKASASLKDTIDNLDKTKNSIYMLSDEAVSEELLIEEEYDVSLNLNAKTLSREGSTADEYIFRVRGTMEIDGTDGTMGGTGSSIISGSHSNLIINGGTYNYIRTYGKVDAKNSIHKCTTSKKDCYPIRAYDKSVSTYDNIQVIGSPGKAFGGLGNTNTTIKNSKLECVNDNCVYFESNGNLTLNNVEINAYGYAIKNNSTNGNVTIIDSTISGAAINGSSYMVIWNASTGSGTVNIKNSNISSANTAVYLTGTGDINVTNSKITGAPDVTEHRTYAAIWNKTSGDASINIKNSTINSSHATVFMDPSANGTIEISDNSTLIGAVNGSTRSVIMNMSTANGIINIKNSVVKGYNPTVYLTGSGDININNSNLNASNAVGIYINENATADSHINIYETNVKTGYHGIGNAGATNIYVYNSNFSAYYSAIVNNSDTGVINIDGGTYTVDGEGLQGAISNRLAGTINICSGTANGLGSKFDLYNGGAGYINYNSNVVLKNNKIYDVNNPTHVVVNNSMTCK